MKKLDKFFKYLFIFLSIMTILYAIEMLFTHYACYDFPNSNLRGKICGVFYSNFGNRLYKILATCYSSLLLLNLPYFIYLLLRKNGFKKSILTFIMNSIIVIFTFFISVMTSVIGL